MCEKYFGDDAGNTEITKEQTVILATGHNWGAPEFVWTEDGKSCKAVFTCENDETNKSEETAEVTSEIKTEPTCTEMGVTAYTATVTFNGETYTDTKEVTDIPATGHDTEIKNAKDATCTQNGYTGDKVCKICGEVVEKDKNIEKLAHNYKDGKCTVCGTKDPNYSKPTEDTQPPQTGQKSNLPMWYTLMIIACIAFVGIIIYTKKKQNK